MLCVIFGGKVHLSRRTLWVCFFILGGMSGMAYAVNTLPSNRVSDVANTRHNFSAAVTPNLPPGESRNVRAVSEQQICVFCHTPHGGQLQASVPTPIWNRSLSAASYVPYSSGSIDATDINQPGGVSKLCLSCHDGTLAIGAVNVLNGAFTDKNPSTADITMSGTDGLGHMPAGAGVTTGFTRNLGTDLTNDHPISFTFDSNLASRDGELRDPAQVSHLGNRVPGKAAPLVPLDNNQVQCSSCHDPHIRDQDPTQNIKFLRLNRFQKQAPVAGAFNETTNIICLACHDKAGWVGSAHANPDVADERYSNAAADLRQFPRAMQVWESACLTCHDTHTVQGARRLLREGVESKGSPKVGGAPALEETCYACHSADGNTLTAQGYNTQVPDIKTDFTTLSVRMPISSSDQPAGEERHNIGSVTLSDPLAARDHAGADFIEGRATLGKGNLLNRHVECTDCHNPHRVIKNRQFNGNPAVPDAAGTHNHGATHSNLASGVLRGAWGVEPVYTSNSFHVEPTDFQVKRGNPPVGGGTAVTQSYVTREYQVCLKCHSNYGYDKPPMLGSFAGGTSPNTNNMTQYTNQAREYNAPVTHKGENISRGTDGGADSAYNSGNHRGWHPVLRETGRDAATRQADANNWIAPYNGSNLGVQTMYCTDCHGSGTAPGTVAPDGGENGKPWGPHGSNNNFLLKGPWSGARNGGTGEAQFNSSDTRDHLCFKCHVYDQYANPNAPVVQDSGFSGGGGMCMGMCGGGMGGGMGGAFNNLHIFHANVVSAFRCNLCHVAVPHGWKNKALLVNLNDVGPEGGYPGTGNEVRFTTAGYVNGPYYNRAALKVVSFAPSGTWSPGNCGSRSGPTGVAWMTSAQQGCQNVP